MSEEELNEVNEEWVVEQENVKEGYGEVLPENSVYLSGPMRKEPEEGRVWRDEIKEEYEEDFNFLDPYDSFDPNKGEIVLESEMEDPDSQIMVSDLVETDKNMICGADYMFVGLSDVISRGTCMEIIFAHHHEIPVFLWDRGSGDLSPWVIYHTVYRSDDKEEVMQAMEGWE